MAINYERNNADQKKNCHYKYICNYPYFHVLINTLLTSARKKSVSLHFVFSQSNKKKPKLCLITQTKVSLNVKDKKVYDFFFVLKADF